MEDPIPTFFTSLTFARPLDLPSNQLGTVYSSTIGPLGPYVLRGCFLICIPFTRTGVVSC